MATGLIHEHDRVTGDVKTFAPQAKKIHVEVDASELHKNIPVDLPILADLRDVLQALMPGLEPLRHDAWIGHLSELRGHARSETILEDDGVLRAPQVIHELWKAMGGACTLVVSGDDSARRIGAGLHPFRDEPLACGVVDVGTAAHAPVPEDVKAGAAVVLLDQNGAPVRPGLATDAEGAYSFHAPRYWVADQACALPEGCRISVARPTLM